MATVKQNAVKITNYYYKLFITYCITSNLSCRTMTGRGKGGKGLGKGGAKRHRKVLRDNIQVKYEVCKWVMTYSIPRASRSLLFVVWPGGVV